MSKTPNDSKNSVNNGINLFTTSSKAKLAGCVEIGPHDYEPFQHRDFVNGLGTMGALFHMIKGSLGSGILSMPMAFRDAGLWVGLIGAILIGMLCTHCVHILVMCSQVLSKRIKRPSLGFAETTEAAFSTGPVMFRRYAGVAREVVNVSLILSYYLGTTVYIVFIAASFKQVVDSAMQVDLNIRLYILMVMVVIVPIGSIRHLKYLVPFSFFALLCLIFGCGFVLYDVFTDLPPLSSRPFFSSWKQLPLFYATMCFSIEGIGTVLPIENAMKKPKHFLSCPWVLNVAMTWLVLMYSMVGFFGYLRYGEATEGSVTLNLGHTFMGEMVKILVALNVCCSYGLIFCVPSESMWKYVEPLVKEENKTRSYYTMRLLLILGTVALATALPDLEPAIGLVGTICYSTLGLLFPSLLELITFWDDPVYMGRWRWRYYKDFLLSIAWLVALVAGLQASIAKVVEIYWN
ncbi:proton-coupled amino acid transporter-like protein pathetic [Macrosteles quadrilineatus]|uniref:proton-coupled amino acid transporter-like protein pathetic n=1 Tax=Macrosteles quadrilineatus TaxID=74068 RepID=UPI0023E122A1|nr:proton-coupled amino acid transporter-like protein pathetic [Macrosteles quadrilineatus]